MSRSFLPQSKIASEEAHDEAPADEDETRAFLLARSKRSSAPVPKYFIQNPDRSLVDRSGPLAEFVRNGDVRGLRALLFLHAIISSGEGDNGWSTTLPLSVWARAFDTTKTASGRSSSTSATKILTRLVERHMILRTRTGRGRNITVTLLRPDGSGDAYTRPDGSADKFIKLTNQFWTEGWHEKLDMAAIAMLLVALHEKPGFELPTERVPAWYGWSADTAERGLKTLRDEGILEVRRRIKKAPLSPTGATAVNIYSLTHSFANEQPSKTSAGSQQAAAKQDGGGARLTNTDSLEQKYAHIPEAPEGTIEAIRRTIDKSSTKSGLR